MCGQPAVSAGVSGVAGQGQGGVRRGAESTVLNDWDPKASSGGYYGYPRGYYYRPYYHRPSD